MFTLTKGINTNFFVVLDLSSSKMNTLMPKAPGMNMTPLRMSGAMTRIDMVQRVSTLTTHVTMMVV